jgi:subtilisin family serine protease
MAMGVHAEESRTIAYDANGIPYIAGEIIVKYNSEAIATRMAGSGDDFSSYVDTYMVEAVHALDLSVEVDLSEIVPGMQLTSVDPTVPIEAAVQMLEQSQYVVYAEPNYLISLDPIEAVPVDQSFAALSAQPLQVPNDSYYSLQWGLPKIQADKAWDITTGSQDIIIAVVDTGVDYNHPDLNANMWKDADGYYGWNFVSNNPDPMDDNGHGTHVAGILGAVGNNGIGIAGTNWNVKIMSLKFMGEDGRGSTLDAVKAIQYAAKMGADIINCSWGSEGYSFALADAIEHTNALFVAAAGNEKNNNDINPNYPSNYGYSNLISVAATDQSDLLASFSNYGQTTVHVAAPGVQIASTYPANRYVYLNGTSMAAPFVSGIAGLMFSVCPSLSPAELKSLILENIDVVPVLSSKISTGGRVNAEKAVIAAMGECFIPIEYTITSSVLDTDGTIDPLGPQLVAAGDDIEFTIAATTTDYVIADILIDSVTIAPDSRIGQKTATYEFLSVTADHTIDVAFEPAPTGTYTIIAYGKEGGIAVPTGKWEVDADTEIVISFDSRPGYELDYVIDMISEERWEDPAPSYLSLTMDRDYEIVAVGKKRENQILVDFTADICKANETPCSGKVPLDVVFTPKFIGTEPDEPYTWVWDFGNGQRNETPRTTDTMPGLYTVSLTGIKGNQSGTETKIGYIHVESIMDQYESAKSA